MLYEIEDVSFAYSLGQQKIQALELISLKIPEGSFVGITGPSGSGKSTLLNLLGLIEPLQSGKILFLKESFADLSESQKNQVRKQQIGFIFQQFHLMPVLTAEENVAYFLYQQNISKNEIIDRTRNALQAVGLWEHRKKKPWQMSGGQKQRVAIARAIAKKPQVIIADEPTASLDQATGRQILQILKDLVDRQGVSVILTTHDPMVLSFCQHQIHLQDGKVR